MLESSKLVKAWRKIAWRKIVVAAALEAMHEAGGWRTLSGPAKVECCFFMARPKIHYGTGKNSNVLRPDAPLYPAQLKRNDLTKLWRGTEDALTDAGVWDDDGRVVDLSLQKMYSATSYVGSFVVVREL